MLIDTPEGIVNTDHIVSIEAVANGTSGTVRFADGTTRITRDFEQFERACGCLVPAQPGFDVVTAVMPHPDKTGVIYSIETAIAFRIGAGIEVPHPMPVTVSGEPSHHPSVFWTVRQPNGVCVGPDGSHDDLDAFKAHCERWAEKLLKRPV